MVFSPFETFSRHSRRRNMHLLLGILFVSHAAAAAHAQYIEKKIKFDTTSDTFTGFGCNGENIYTITDVTKKSQADMRGVQVGWKIASAPLTFTEREQIVQWVNGVWQEAKAAPDGHGVFEITFQIDVSPKAILKVKSKFVYPGIHKEDAESDEGVYSNFKQHALYSTLRAVQRVEDAVTNSDTFKELQFELARRTNETFEGVLSALNVKQQQTVTVLDAYKTHLQRDDHPLKVATNALKVETVGLTEKTKALKDAVDGANSAAETLGQSLNRFNAQTAVNLEHKMNNLLNTLNQLLSNEKMQSLRGLQETLTTANTKITDAANNVQSHHDQQLLNLQRYYDDMTGFMTALKKELKNAQSNSRDELTALIKNEIKESMDGQSNSWNMIIAGMLAVIILIGCVQVAIAAGLGGPRKHHRRGRRHDFDERERV